MLSVLPNQQDSTLTLSIACGGCGAGGSNGGDGEGADGGDGGAGGGGGAAACGAAPPVVKNVLVLGISTVSMMKTVF